MAVRLKSWMSCTIGETVSINSLENRLIQKIQECNNQLSFNPRLTKVSQSFADLILKKIVKNATQGQITIKNLFPIADEIDHFSCVQKIDNKSSLSSDNWIFDILKNRALCDHLDGMNNFGVGVLALKNNKVIVFIIYAKFDIEKISNKALECFPKIQNITKEKAEINNETFLRAINLIRNALQLREVSLDLELENNLQKFVENCDSDDILIGNHISLFPLQNEMHPIQSCLINPHFISILLSPIESVGIYFQKNNHSVSKLFLKINNLNIEQLLEKEMVYDPGLIRSFEPRNGNSDIPNNDSNSSELIFPIEVKNNNKSEMTTSETGNESASMYNQSDEQLYNSEDNLTKNGYLDENHNLEKNNSSASLSSTASFASYASTNASQVLTPEELENKYVERYDSVVGVSSSIDSKITQTLRDFIEQNNNNFETQCNHQAICAVLNDSSARVHIYSNTTWTEISKRIRRNPNKYPIASIVACHGRSDGAFNIVIILDTKKANTPATPSTVKFENHETVNDISPMNKTPASHKSNMSNQTPLKEIADKYKSTSMTPNSSKTSNIPKMYSEPSKQLEFEIKETLSGLYHYQKIQFDDELSNKLRQIITEQYAKNPHFKDTEVRAIFEKEMQYAWVRIIRKPTNEEIIRDVRASYRDRFLKKLTNSKNIAVAAIFDRNNTPIGCILTGNALSPEEIEKQQNQSSNKPQEFTNTGEHKPPNSSKKSLSQQKRYINDFERSHLFLTAFNEYRKSFNKPDFEFCQEFLNIAKQYSKSCGEVQTILNPNTFIETANQINGVSNVKGFGIQAAKHSNYVDRAMEEIKQKYNDIILSDSNKISIGYWNNEFGQVFISFFIGDLVQNE